MPASRTTILIVEDERPWAQFLKEFLEGLGYACRIAETGADAVEAFRAEPTDVVLTDLRLPDFDGMEVTRRVRALSPDTIVIMMTGCATSEAAIQAFECGATDYITKPFNASQVHLCISRVLERRRIEEENERLRRLLKSRSCFDQIVGAAPAMQALYQLIPQVAPNDTPVLISGEPGTGKSLLAEVLHRASGRPEGLLGICCCSGREAGQALAQCLERCAGGTVVLEAVEALSKSLQAALLAALERGVFHAPGGGHPVPVQVRLIASTDAPLLDLVEQGRFRRELYYRLGVVAISLPPLRDRREDIPLLANFFLEKANRQRGKQVERIDFEAMIALSTHSWPGNVAELEQLIDGLVAADTQGHIRLTDLPESLRRGVSGGESPLSCADVPLREAKRRFEREYFRDLLRRTRGNMSLASRSSRVGRPYLYKKIGDYQIDPNEFR